MTSQSLKRNFVQIFSKLLYQQAERCTVFAIDEMNYVNQSLPQGIFEADKCYFRFRLNEYYLKNSRELWKSYYPLAVSLTQFMYKGAYEEVPCTIGPELLKSLNINEGKDYINFQDIKLVGNLPYLGGDINFFLGLIRVQKNDWSYQLSSFLDTLSSSVSLGHLSSGLNLIKPLTHSVEKLLSMGQRIYPAEHCAYSQPSESLINGTLRPSTIVILGLPEHEVNISNFWLKENRLFYGNNVKSLSPYSNADYLMYSIEYQKNLELGELSSMDFYQNHWSKIKELSLNGQAGAAFFELTLLLSSLSSCADLTQADQLGLLLVFPGLLNKYLANYQQGIGSILDSLQKAQQIRQLGEKTFQTALNYSEKLNNVNASLGVQEARDFFVAQIANPTKSIDEFDAIQQAFVKGQQLINNGLSPSDMALGLSNLRF